MSQPDPARVRAFVQQETGIDVVPYGFCHCGCGQKTDPARQSHTAKGWVKGQPLPFRSHHRRRVSGKDHPQWNGGRTIRQGYVFLLMPEHPNADRHGYVREHTMIAERVLGKPLPKGAEVHHANRDRSDNRPENLVICQDRAYHMLIHQRMRAKDACGNPNWLRCRICKQYDAPENMHPRLHQGRAFHSACAVRHNSALRSRRRKEREAR